MDGYDEREDHEVLEEDDLGQEMYPRNAAVHTESVSQMGRLLLQGYAMLADSCDTCGMPLMRKPHGEEVICVNCEALHEESREQKASSGALKEDLESSTHAAVQTGDRTQDSTGLHGANDIKFKVDPSIIEKNDVDVAQELADLMVKRWRLMAESCPICHSPLARSPDSRVYCVKCKAYVAYQDEKATADILQNNGKEKQEYNKNILPLPETSQRMEMFSRPRSPDWALQNHINSTTLAVSECMSLIAQELAAGNMEEMSSRLKAIHEHISVLKELRSLSMTLNA